MSFGRFQIMLLASPIIWLCSRACPLWTMRFDERTKPRSWILIEPVVREEKLQSDLITVRLLNTEEVEGDFINFAQNAQHKYSYLCHGKTVTNKPCFISNRNDYNIYERSFARLVERKTRTRLERSSWLSLNRSMTSPLFHTCN